MANIPPPTGSSSRPVVLVVDDDASIRTLCQSKLQSQGFAVLEAPGSSEALKLSHEHTGPIHLVIADLFLPPPALQLAGASATFPRIHGHELVQTIVRKRPDTRVLLVTAYTEEELRDHGIAADHLPLLRKPFTGEALLAAAQQALTGPRVTVQRTEPKTKDGKDVEWYD